MRFLPHPSFLATVTIVGVFVVGVSALLTGSGCTVLTNDALPDDAGVFEAGEASVSTCNACVADECTAAWAMCLTNESCIGIRTCASGAECGAGCKTACACTATSDAGLAPESLYRAFTACNDARTCGVGCTTDCAARCKPAAELTTPPSCTDAGVLTDAGTDAAVDTDAGDAGDVDASLAAPTADSCRTCASDKCGDSKKACALGSECATFLECTFACGDSTCVEDCGRLHATGKVAAVELATCTQAGCERECGLVNR